MDIAKRETIDVAVVDYQLGGRNGLWLSRKLKRLPAAAGRADLLGVHRRRAVRGGGGRRGRRDRQQGPDRLRVCATRSAARQRVSGAFRRSRPDLGKASGAAWTTRSRRSSDSCWPASSRPKSRSPWACRPRAWSRGCGSCSGGSRASRPLRAHDPRPRRGPRDGPGHHSGAVQPRSHRPAALHAAALPGGGDQRAVVDHRGHADDRAARPEQDLRARPRRGGRGRPGGGRAGRAGQRLSAAPDRSVRSRS